MDILKNKCIEFNKISNNPYFKILKNNPSKQEFCQSQNDFIYAIDNWSRVLGVLLSKLPTDFERSIIIQNLYDEHGEGDIKNSHVNTFGMLLGSLGYDVIERKPNQFVSTFNNDLMNYVNTKNWIKSVSCIAMIEYTYITVSTIIHQYLTNYLEPDNINHYSLHEVVDIKHSDELLSLIAPYWDTHNKSIMCGIYYGYQLIDKLYNGMSLILLHCVQENDKNNEQQSIVQIT